MHVNRGSVLQLGSAVFEGQLMTGPRPSLIVKGALAQDEVMIVKIELRSVVEEHFADLAVEGVRILVDLETEFLKRLGGILPELQEPFLARKAIGLKQDLVFAVMDHVRAEVMRFGVLADVLIHKPKL